MFINYVVNGDEVVLSRQTFERLKRHIEKLEQEVQDLKDHIDVIEEEAAASFDSFQHYE